MDKKKEDIGIVILKYGKEQKNFSREQIGEYLLSKDYDIAGVDKRLFRNFLSMPYFIKENDGTYSFLAEGYFALLDYEELEHARKSSAEAKKDALNALKISIGSIILSIFISLISIYYSVVQTNLAEEEVQAAKMQINSKTDLSDSTLTEIKLANTPSLNQVSAKLDSLIFAVKELKLKK